MRKLIYSQLFFFLTILSLTSCEDNIVVQSIKINSNEGLGIMVNIAADGLVLYIPWGKGIDYLTKDQIEKLLSNYVDTYADTQVSTLIFNVNYQRSCFQNKTMTTYWDIINPDVKIKSWPKFYWQLYKKGVDPFLVSINRSRQRGISPWISVRMNDHHYFDDSLMINKLWLNNPEYRLYSNRLFDYSRVEVREYFKSYIKDVLDTYDVDGIEIDWMRTYTIFKSGSEVSGTTLINDYMAEIRAMVQKKSVERGHQIKIAVRVPPNPTISKLQGLDPVYWVQKGLVDVIVPTNWYRPTNFDIPIESWRKEIGASTNPYQLVPSADDTYMIASNIYIKGMSTTIESMRGFSVSAYSRGADAIYLFNNFLPTYKRKLIGIDGSVVLRDDKPLILKTTGKLSTAQTLPRSHVMTFSDPDTKQKPLQAIPLEINQPKIFSIYSGIRPAKGNYTVRIGIDYSSTAKDAKFVVLVNGNECVQISDLQKDPSYIYNGQKEWDVVNDVSETSYRVLQFNVNIPILRDGNNLISIENKSKEVQKMTWLEAYINE